MKYKVGDKVKIRHDLHESSDWCGSLVAVPKKMLKWAGKVVTISQVRRGDRYDIEEDKGRWVWHESMIQGKAEEEEPKKKNMKYKIGDKVRVRKDLNPNDDYGGIIPVLSMCVLRGKIVTIAECLDWCKVYKIKEDGDDYNWTAEMFEGIAEEPLKEVPTKDTTINDAVSHPSHYTDGRIEVIDFIQDKKLDFARGNVVKYISRAGKKGGSKEKELEDLKKAKQYCEFAIRDLEENGGSND